MSENKKFTDIQNQLLEMLPDSARPYAKLARIDRPTGIWLLLLPGLWGIFMAAGGILGLNPRDWGVIFLFVIGAAIMRSAGCVINDLWDMNLDKKVERTEQRPLANGELSRRQAFAFLGGLLFLGAYILLQLPIMSILLGILTMLLIIAYPLAKRVTHWPQAVLGLTFNMSVLIGWTAVSTSLDMATLCLYLAAILWTLAYDTVYAYQDIVDDARIGVKSTALKFGKNAKKWVGGFFIGIIVMLALAGLIHGVSYLFYPLLGLPAWHFYKQLTLWDPESQESSLAIFKSNTLAGLYILVVCLFS